MWKYMKQWKVLLSEPTFFNPYGCPQFLDMQSTVSINLFQMVSMALKVLSKKASVSRCSCTCSPKITINVLQSQGIWFWFVFQENTLFSGQFYSLQILHPKNTFFWTWLFCLSSELPYRPSRTSMKSWFWTKLWTFHGKRRGKRLTWWTGFSQNKSDGKWLGFSRKLPTSGFAKHIVLWYSKNGICAIPMNTKFIDCPTRQCQPLFAPQGKPEGLFRSTLWNFKSQILSAAWQQNFPTSFSMTVPR